MKFLSRNENISVLEILISYIFELMFRKIRKASCMFYLAMFSCKDTATWNAHP